MVKLVRLTTENDNKFEAQMDSEIKLKANASVALQNLTFESEFTTLTISGAERNVVYNFNTDAYPALENTGLLSIASYNSTNYETFFSDLEGALNDTCSLGGAGRGYPGDTNQQNNYMQFNVFEESDTRSIEMRVTPMLHPLLKTRLFEVNVEPQVSGDYDLSQLLFTAQPAAYNQSELNPVVPSTQGIHITEVADQSQAIFWGVLAREEGTASNQRDRYFVPNDKVEWSKGSAVWWCRVQNLIDNGGGKETNGFAIGLSQTPIVAGNTTIASTHQDFEIRCYKPGDNYEYIDPTTSNSHIDSGVPPVQVSSGTVDAHDIMMLRKDGNLIRGFINTRASGGTSTKIFEYTIPLTERNKPLYPYAYFCGAGEHASMGQPSLTLDPFAIDTLQGSVGNDYLNILTPGGGDQYGFTGVFVNGGPSGYNLSSVGIMTVSPVLDQEYYSLAGKLNQEITLKLNNEVLRFLGFNIVGIGDTTFKPTFNAPSFPFGFEIVPGSTFQVTNSDNYVVVLDSNPLLSYDASRSQGLLLNDKEASKIGRRLNILATIPVNDNSSGVVEFEPNELVYIDLDNEYPQNISNLRLRVLDKSLNPVETIGESVMTLLFKD